LKNRFFGISFLADQFMPAPIFDRSVLKIKSLSQRVHDLSWDVVLDLKQPALLEHQDELKSVAESINRG
jgi:hypothetical protein